MTLGHSKKYSLVKMYRNFSMWNDKMVHDAVAKGWITEEEYEEITGLKYDEYVQKEGQ